MFSSFFFSEENRLIVCHALIMQMFLTTSLGVLLLCTQIPFIESTINPDGHETFGGQFLVEMGNKIGSSELQMIGKTILNLESKIKSTIRSEVILELCRLHNCTDWAVWSKCDVALYGFGSRKRSRECGFKTVLCNRDNLLKTEDEFKICKTKIHKNCPNGFTKTESGLCLSMHKRALSRNGAETECRKENGHLVQINSERTMKDVNKFLAEKYGLNRGFWWIDGLKAKQGGSWKFGYETENQNFKAWGDNEPTNGPQDLCMLYFYKSYKGGSVWRMNDYACTSHAWFICQVIP
jgi:hypothetical protein